MNPQNTTKQTGEHYHAETGEIIEGRMKNDDYIPIIKSPLLMAEMACETASEEWPLAYAIVCAGIILSILYLVAQLRG